MKIGDKELLCHETFMLADGELASLEIKLPSGAPLPLTLRFSPEEGEAEMSWTFVEGVLNIRFKGWRNPLGTCLSKPTKLGDFRGSAIGFTVAHSLIGESNNLVTFQFFQGGTYE